MSNLNGRLRQFLLYMLSAPLIFQGLLISICICMSIQQVVSELASAAGIPCSVDPVLVQELRMQKNGML